MERSNARPHLTKLLYVLTVTAVESAKHVLEVLRAGGPAVDVILSEVEFPHGKGLKLLKHIMREEKLKQIPVVSKSGHPFETKLVLSSLLTQQNPVPSNCRPSCWPGFDKQGWT